MPLIPARWVPTIADVGDAVLGLVTTTLGLGVGVAVVAGVSADHPAAVLAVGRRPGLSS